MNEDVLLKNFRNNPDLFRVYLQDAFKKCFEVISKEKFRSACPSFVKTGKECTELQNHIQEQLITNVNESINYVFENFNVVNKVKEVAKLASAAPANTVAWRPTTGIVDDKAARMLAVHKRKKMLSRKIREADVVTEVLKQNVISERNKLKEHRTHLRKQMHSFKSTDSDS